MLTSCGKSGRVWSVAALALILTGLTATARGADLAQEVSQFISDYDRLIAQRTIIANDRAAMAQNLANPEELRKSVRNFFDDRAEAQAIRLLKALDRRDMRITLGFKGEKLEKPTKGRNDLTLDASSYITNYDGWKMQQALVEQNIETMRSILNSQDPVIQITLASATEQFFINARLRHQKRMQWQADIRAMKKDIGFKGTGKAQKPAGETLADFVSAFLGDRTAWEAKLVQVEADRNGIRMALSGTGLEEAVLKFLQSRRESLLLAKELYMDREAMRGELKAKRFKERKLGEEPKEKDVDSDEEDGSLEEASDIAGEK